MFDERVWCLRPWATTGLASDVHVDCCRIEWYGMGYIDSTVAHVTLIAKPVALLHEHEGIHAHMCAALPQGCQRHDDGKVAQRSYPAGICPKVKRDCVACEAPPPWIPMGISI